MTILFISSFLSGCSSLLGGPAAGAMVDSLGSLQKSAVACAQGQGPLVSAWSVLLLPEGARAPNGVVSVEPGCQIRFGVPK